MEMCFVTKFVAHLAVWTTYTRLYVAHTHREKTFFLHPLPDLFADPLQRETRQAPQQENVLYGIIWRRDGVEPDMLK